MVGILGVHHRAVKPRLTKVAGSNFLSIVRRNKPVDALNDAAFYRILYTKDNAVWSQVDILLHESSEIIG